MFEHLEQGGIVKFDDEEWVVLHKIRPSSLGDRGLGRITDLENIEMLLVARLADVQSVMHARPVPTFLISVPRCIKEFLVDDEAQGQVLELSRRPQEGHHRRGRRRGRSSQRR